jgi:hypothetical protein
MIKQYKFAQFVDLSTRQKLKHVVKLKGGYDLEFSKIDGTDKSYIALNLIKNFRKKVFGKRRDCKVSKLNYLLGATDKHQMYMCLDR